MSEEKIMLSSFALLNLTPHDIMVYPDTNNKIPLRVCPKDKSNFHPKVLERNCILYPKSGVIARLVTKEQRFITTLQDGCPVYEPQEFINIDPAKVPGHLWKGEMRGVIVSMPVAEWLIKHRSNDTHTTGEMSDLNNTWGEIYVADSGPAGALRNSEGVIIGTKRLVRYLPH